MAESKRINSRILKLKFLLLAWIHRDRPRSICFLKRFSYKDLKKATDGFRRIIASHNQGSTYEARFQDGSAALVKEIRDTRQRNDVFYSQLRVLGRLHHRHIVALQGYSEGHRSFLVFESTRHGSLKEHLNDPLKTPLSWKTRLQIAVGIAAALEYLHSFSDPPVYHVSISSNNILLDDKFAAKLADVALLNSSRHHDQMTHTLCSKECKDQEQRNITYQFGALLLELITGQSTEKGNNVDIINWIQESCFGTSLQNMIDPDLGNSYDSKELRSLLAVARLCVEPGNKPALSISHVLRYLQHKVGILSR